MASFSWEMIKLCYTPLIGYYASTKIRLMSLQIIWKHPYMLGGKKQNREVCIQCDYNNIF